MRIFDFRNRLVEKRDDLDAGQVALILVLAISVAGALAVSLVSRTTTNLRTQELDIESAKALKAAESGVEEALLIGGMVSNTTLGDTSYVVGYESTGGDGSVSVDVLQPGDVLEVLVDGADATLTSLDIYFTSMGSDSALKIGEYLVDETPPEPFDYSVDYFAVDGNAARRAVNNFSVPESVGYSFLGVDFSHKTTIDVNVDDFSPPVTKIVRIKVLYAGTRIGVSPVPAGSALPGQQVMVSSTGTFTDSGVMRKINLRKESERLPAVFDQVLYSGSGLVQ